MSESMRKRQLDKIRSNQPIPAPDGPILLPCQSATINRFDNEGVASNAITMLSTRLTYLHILRHLGLMFPKPYIELTKDDYIIYFSHPMATNTRRGKMRIVKRFNRWLYNLPERKYPEALSFLGKNPKPVSNITAADLLTKEELLALLREANTQDRARIGVLFDTAGRNSEIFYLRKKDVTRSSYGYKITLKSREGSKTKAGLYGNRTLPMVNCKLYLTNWINEHPSWHTLDNPPLWVNSFNGETMEDETSFSKKLKRIAKKAGVNKRVYNHIFRHSKLTDCARMRMTESSMRKFAGWSPTSNMPATYVHLSGVELEREALRSAGIEIPDEEPMFMGNTVCPECGEENELHARYCIVCFSSLDLKEYEDAKVMKMADVLNKHQGMRDKLYELLKPNTVAP